MRANALLKRATVCLLLLQVTALTPVCGVGTAPPLASTANYCPIVPQTRVQPARLPSSEGVIDFTGGQAKPSAHYAVVKAKPKDLVFIDGGTLRDEASVDAIRRSKAVIMLHTNDNPMSAKALLEREIRGVDVVATLPDDARGVSLMYQSDTGKYGSVVDYYTAMSSDFKKLSNGSVVSKAVNGSKIRDVLLTEVRSSKAKDRMLIIVGHNEDGVLRLPDGSSIAISELAEASARGGRATLVLSCETLNDVKVAQAGFVTTRPLYFDEILGALQFESRKSAQKSAAISVGDIVRLLNEGFAPQNETKTKVAVVAAAAVGGTVVVVVAIGGNQGDCTTRAVRLRCRVLTK